MKDWKTTIGGATNTLGKTLRAIPAAMIAFDPACITDPSCVKKYAIFYIVGLVVSSIGGFFSDLFAADSGPATTATITTGNQTTETK